MPKYSIDVYSTIRHRFYIEADTQEEADAKARSHFVNAPDTELAMHCKDWDIEHTFIEEIIE